MESRIKSIPKDVFDVVKVIGFKVYGTNKVIYIFQYCIT